MKLKKIFNHPNNHLQELLDGAVIAFFFKILAAGAIFLLNVVLARLLGAEGSGVFFLAYTIVLVFATVGRFGMENTIVKFIASNDALGFIGKVIGVYQKAMLYSFLLALILSFSLYFSSAWISNSIFLKPELESPLSIMALAIVPLALLTLHAHAFQGLKKIAEFIFILSVSVPMITVVLSFIFIPTHGIDAASLGYLLSTIITLIFSRWLWLKQTKISTSVVTVFDTNELLKSSLPLFGMVVMNMLITWSPMLFLGVFESNENVGIYSAANRTAMLTSFVLVAVNSIAAPKFAALYKERDYKTLSLVVQNSSKIMIILALPILIFFLFFPSWILSFFGPQFSQGAHILIILAIGQFINVSTGSVGYLLMMSGNEVLMRNNLIFCAIFGVLLNFLLISEYGILGAAIATSIILSIQNIIALILVWKKLHIMTFPYLTIKISDKR
jgi:O-antigen/teichoic acid export membrane protein